MGLIEAEILLQPFRTEYGNMTKKAKYDELLRGLWMGVIVIIDALELKLDPIKYMNKKTTPLKNKEEQRETKKKLKKGEKDKTDDDPDNPPKFDIHRVHN